jgi:Asp-tRNA(Asn)/Glu-tRNA(Gln) amidotransferase A subunit family amidase
MEKNDIDVVISPTAIGEEPPLISNFTNIPRDSKTLSPVYEYKNDYFTAFPNTLGIPSITLPIQETWGKDPKTGELTSAYKFPSSVKICNYFGEDYHLLRIARQMEIMIEEAGMQGTLQ